MFERIRSILAEFVEGESKEITLDTNIKTDLDLNSLELVNLAVEIGDEFDVDIPDSEIYGIETVKDIINLIERYSGK